MFELPKGRDGTVPAANQAGARPKYRAAPAQTDML